ncbi:MAG TPA: hypothetical protein VND22_06045 [Actinomycetota bacterium]|nr:hypothetical protein [Actinomycetota bacterium]
MTRRIAILAALVGWVYSWYLFRGVRNEFQVGSRSLAPSWLVLMLVASSTVLIAAAIAAGIKLKVWPLLVVAGGIAMFLSVVLAQFAVMRAFSPEVTLGEALSASFRTRSVVGAFFISAVPALLVVSGSAAAFGPAARRGETLHA